MQSRVVLNNGAGFECSLDPLSSQILGNEFNDGMGRPNDPRALQVTSVLFGYAPDE